MTPVSWRAAYTGMIRSVASWGIEIGWRGQKEWRKEMTLLQNAALRKAVGAVKGSSGDKVEGITAVEDVETFARASVGRFLARTMCDPRRAGLGVVDTLLDGEGELSLGGGCWKGTVAVAELAACGTSTPADWKRAIEEAVEGSLVVYTDESMNEVGQVGGGWYASDDECGSVAVGTTATVWDGEIAGIRQALRMMPDEDLLVLTDSTAALASITQAAKAGWGRTRDLVEVVDEVGRRAGRGLRVRFAWVKSHVGIPGNELADTKAKAGCRVSLLPQVTEGGVRALWKRVRQGRWARNGLGLSRVVRWTRRAALRYTHLRVGKGDVGQWRRVLGRGEHLCRLCGTEEETGAHLVMACDEVSELSRWSWRSWEEMDDRRKGRYIEEDGEGKQVVRDRVGDFFVDLDRVLVGVG